MDDEQLVDQLIQIGFLPREQRNKGLEEVKTIPAARREYLQNKVRQALEPSTALNPDASEHLVEVSSANAPEAASAESSNKLAQPQAANPTMSSAEPAEGQNTTAPAEQTQSAETILGSTILGAETETQMNEPRLTSSHHHHHNHCVREENLTQILKEFQVQMMQALSTMLNNHQPTEGTTESVRAPRTKQGANTMPNLDLKLDRITIPTFNGDLTNWIAFRDQFNDLVHNNGRVTPIIKFNILRSHLTGLALDAINGFNLTNADYETAWSLLLSRYDRPDQIIGEYLNKFSNLPKLQSAPTSTQLITMVNCTNQILRVLPNLGVPVTNWDPWMSHHLKARLDTTTLNKWLDQAKGRQQIKLPELLEFLELQATERSITTPQLTSSPITEIRKWSQTDSHEDTKQCVFCDHNHPIFRCPTFNSLPLTTKTDIVNQEELCHKCLLGHDAAVCSFPPCPHCGMEHNRRLCPTKEKRTLNEHSSS